MYIILIQFAWGLLKTMDQLFKRTVVLPASV